MGSDPKAEPVAATTRGLLGPRGRTALTATAVGLSGFLCLAVWQLLLASIAVPVTGSLTEIEQTLLGTVALGLGMGSAALLYLTLADREWSFVDLSWPSATDAGYAVLGVVVLLGASFGLEELFAVAGIETAQHGIAETAAGAPEVLLLLIPASWVLVGPGEELLFRNVVQKSLYGEFSRPAAVLLASTVFAAVHLPAYSTGTPSQVLASLSLVFALSIVLGGVYARTDSLAVPAFVHGTYNAVQFAILYATLSGGKTPALAIVL